MKSYQSISLERQNRQVEATRLTYLGMPGKAELVKKMQDHVNGSNPHPFVQSIYKGYQEHGGLTPRQETAVGKFLK